MTSPREREIEITSTGLQLAGAARDMHIFADNLKTIGEKIEDHLENPESKESMGLRGFTSWTLTLIAIIGAYVDSIKRLSWEVKTLLHEKEGENVEE